MPPRAESAPGINPMKGRTPKMETIKNLYNTILDRRENPKEGSYTNYLFEQGLDKILKKCGEECSEVIIAAKNEKKDEIILEIGDLAYHMLILAAQCGITPDDISAELEKRSQKTGNLKIFHKTDTNS